MDNYSMHFFWENGLIEYRKNGIFGMIHVKLPVTIHFNLTIFLLKLINT